MLKQKLHITPVSNPQRVLDIGTGTGIWAIDFGMNFSFLPQNSILTPLAATQNPSADVIGTDLSPIQPPLFVNIYYIGGIALTSSN
jgi:methylase of polypeptide subunit release factors